MHTKEGSVDKAESLFCIRYYLHKKVKDISKDVCSLFFLKKEIPFIAITEKYLFCSIVDGISIQ